MLNLLPWRGQKLRRERKWILGFLTFFTLITIGTSYFVKKIYENKIQQKRITVKLYEMRIDSKLKSVAQLNSILANKSYEKNAAQDLNQLFSILNVIVKTLPLNCYLTCLILDHHGLLLEGVSLSPVKDAFLKYVTRLQQYLPYNIKVLSMSAGYETLSYKLFIEMLSGKSHA
jgi:hypothetical protein